MAQPQSPMPSGRTVVNQRFPQPPLHRQTATPEADRVASERALAVIPFVFRAAARELAFSRLDAGLVPLHGRRVKQQRTCWTPRPGLKSTPPVNSGRADRLFFEVAFGHPRATEPPDVEANMLAIQFNP